MLCRLSISNIVLIEKLCLEFGHGLNILTGETGAGKSILMDALALALGARSDTGLIRHGCDGASVTAEFDHIPDTLGPVLVASGIDMDEGDLILRRSLGADGKSRAWINDTPVSIKTLKQIGDSLVEIHGQFENHSLLDSTTHRATLDEFGRGTIDGYDALLCDVADAYDAYHAANSELQDLSARVAQAESEREFLEHNVAELRALNPQVGEEQDLAARRADMMNAEKNAAILADAAAAIAPHGTGLDAQVFSVAHILERIKGDTNPYQEQIDKLYDVAAVLADVSERLTPGEMTTDDIDSVEERLFALRSVARKHHVTVDELPATLEQMAAALDSIDNSDAQLKQLRTAVAQHRARFDAAAKKLTAARGAARDALRTQILAELPDLKLGSADFMAELSPCDPSRHGVDDVMFMIRTNPGTPFAPLHKTASGGELARLMLALRVVLGRDASARTFVFDEVDTGISGATASAVGLRLNRLAAQNQALVITHSAQVAGYADHHFKIEKHVQDNCTTTTVHEISGDTRLHEIARIISGAKITPESIATAKTLIK